MLVFVIAHLIILVIHTKSVDPHVLSILIAHLIKCVYKINVEIPVPACVGKTQNAQLLITNHSVLVVQDSLAIHSLSVLLIVSLNYIIVKDSKSETIINSFIYSLVIKEKENVCSPSPCGPNSQCKDVSGQPVCSCLPTYVGNPPGCRPECVVSSDCPSQLACKDHKCINPCPSPCGLNTKCIVVNHSPICSCAPGYSGNPFTVCTSIPCKILTNNLYIIL